MGNMLYGPDGLTVEAVAYADRPPQFIIMQGGRRLAAQYGEKVRTVEEVRAVLGEHLFAALSPEPCPSR